MFKNFISLWFACNIQSSVVEGLWLCRSGSILAERCVRRAGVQDQTRRLQRFIAIFTVGNKFLIPCYSISAHSFSQCCRGGNLNVDFVYHWWVRSYHNEYTLNTNWHWFIKVVVVVDIIVVGGYVFFILITFYIIDHQPCPNGQLQFWGLYQTDKGEKKKKTHLPTTISTTTLINQCQLVFSVYSLWYERTHQW